MKTKKRLKSRAELSNRALNYALVRPKRAAAAPVREYDEAAFCDEALNSLQRVQTYVSRRMGWATSEDLLMDFIEKMLRTGWWRRFDPERGTLKQFVVQFLMTFLLDARCRRPLRHVRDTARANERARMLAANPATAHPREISGRAEAARAVLERIHLRVPPETSAVLDLLLGSGGSPRDAVLDHPVEIQEIRDELRVARLAAKEAGLSWDSV